MEGALQVYRCKPRGPVDEVDAFRLARLDAADEHVRRAVRRNELEPSFPHAVRRMTSYRTRAISSLGILDVFVVGDKDFSHSLWYSSPTACNVAASAGE